MVIPTGTGIAGKVVFGATVTLRDLSDESHGDEKRYRIVGDLEADIKNNAISLSSPLAASLVNKNLGDVVTVNLPRGEKEYEIVAIGFDG